MVRMDATGRYDRSAILPTGVNGAPMATTGPFAAMQDGSTWTVSTDGTNNYLLRYQPTALTHVAVWTGAAGDGRWSTAANWQGDTPPSNGDAVELPTASTMVDDLPGLTLQELLLSGPAHLSGAPLSFGAGGVQLKSKVQASIANPIAINGGALQIVLDPLGGPLTLSGMLSGSGGLKVVGTSRGSGLVVLTANNTYSGATDVVNGTLEIDGSQPNSSVTLSSSYLAAAIVTGNGTTGSVTADSGGALLGPLTSVSPCPTTLNIHGNLVLAANSAFIASIVGCGTPTHQAASHVKVTGTVSIDPQSFFFLATIKDTTQLACLISSQGPMSGAFGGAAEGSTSPDYGADQGDVVRFSYQTPGGAGCYAHAFTAQTGIDP
jgi:autotransporter-associated beta strand protein